jgi:uncharacterized protein DUF222
VAADTLVRALEPAAVALPDALPMWEAFDRIERSAATAKLLLTARVDESRAAQRSGHRDTAELLAKKAGTSTGAARRQLETARKLRELPATGEALRNGDLSADQAEVVAGAASANPGAEWSLLEQARAVSFAELREEGLHARVQVEGREATQRRIHAARRLRTWTDAEGAWNLSARGTVVDGSKVMRALKPIIDTVFREARQDGRRDEHETYAFDALVRLAERPDQDAPDATATKAGHHQGCRCPARHPPGPRADRGAAGCVAVELARLQRRGLPPHARRDRPPRALRKESPDPPRRTGPPVRAAPPPETPRGLVTRRGHRQARLRPARRPPPPQEPPQTRMRRVSPAGGCARRGAGRGGRCARAIARRGTARRDT